MRVLFDECLPGRKLKPAFAQHDVKTVTEMGWQSLKNGALLKQAEVDFDAFVTADKNLRYQQRTSQYDLVIVVLRASSNRLADLLPLVREAHDVLASGIAGEIYEISI